MVLHNYINGLAWSYLDIPVTEGQSAVKVLDDFFCCKSAKSLRDACIMFCNIYNADRAANALLADFSRYGYMQDLNPLKSCRPDCLATYIIKSMNYIMQDASNYTTLPVMSFTDVIARAYRAFSSRNGRPFTTITMPSLIDDIADGYRRELNKEVPTVPELLSSIEPDVSRAEAVILAVEINKYDWSWIASASMFVADVHKTVSNVLSDYTMLSHLYPKTHPPRDMFAAISVMREKQQKRGHFGRMARLHSRYDAQLISAGTNK